MHLCGRKENETKLMSLPAFLWKHENVLDGMSDPSAVVLEVSKVSEISSKSYKQWSSPDPCEQCGSSIVSHEGHQGSVWH